MEICWDRVARKLWLSQKHNVTKLLAKFSMHHAKPTNTLLTNHFKLFAGRCLQTFEEIQDMLKVSYAIAVGCLMYAMICTRQDLLHVVSIINKSMVNPGKEHLKTIKWIFRYLRGTVD